MKFVLFIAVVLVSVQLIKPDVSLEFNVTNSTIIFVSNISESTTETPIEISTVKINEDYTELYERSYTTVAIDIPRLKPRNQLKPALRQRRTREKNCLKVLTGLDNWMSLPESRKKGKCGAVYRTLYNVRRYNKRCEIEEEDREAFDLVIAKCPDTASAWRSFLDNSYLQTTQMVIVSGDPLIINGGSGRSLDDKKHRKKRKFGFLDDEERRYNEGDTILKVFDKMMLIFVLFVVLIMNSAV